MQRASPAADRIIEVPATVSINRQIARRLAERYDFSRLPTRSVPAGGWLHHIDTRMDRLPYVESGCVHGVVRLSGGAEVVTITFHEGELALLGSLFSDEPIRGDLVASTVTRIKWVPRSEIEPILLGDRELLLLTLKFFVQGWQDARSRERIWLLRGADERVHAALARVALESPRQESGFWPVEITHDELALRSGISRPKVSNALKRLEKHGVIRLGRGMIEILDYEMLTHPS